MTRPTLMIEKIDSDNALHLRVSTSLPGLDPDFMESYDVTRVASINDLEKKIDVSDVRHAEIVSVFAEIEKLLKKHKRGMPSSPSRSRSIRRFSSSPKKYGMADPDP